MHTTIKRQPTVNDLLLDIFHNYDDIDAITTEQNIDDMIIRIYISNECFLYRFNDLSFDDMVDIICHIMELVEDISTS